MKVKIFYEDSPKDLEEKINRFLSEKKAYIYKIEYRPTSRKLSTSHSAIITYEE